MKKPDITPGPWRVSHNLRYGPSGKKHADQWWISSDTRKAMVLLEVWEITEESWSDLKIAEEQNETLTEVALNAKAIAAVPDLLEALEKLLSYYESNGNANGFPIHLCPEHGAARAALEKAGYQFSN